MKFFKTFNTFSLLAILFFACSTARKEPTATTNNNTHVEQELQSAVAEKPRLIKLIEPVGAAGKSSWAEYKSGMQAIEAEDYLTAMHYLDLSLGEVYSEQQSDSIGAPEDSAYYSSMPKQIILALESLYPKLISMSSTAQDFSILNDYENIDDFEDVPLDSAEKKAIENFLDTIDMSRFSMPVVINERVMQEIRYLTTGARSFTERSLSRKTTLDSMIFAKLRQRKMPEDLIYLALVESGFKVNAYSRAKAAGVWQFIPATGKRYGLPVDFWLDMRRNPEAATDAALEYLSTLYKEFDDWYLAMAAYNCGEGRIRRLVKEGLAANPSLKKVSYWDLKLPRETMHYVPRILAATIIGHFPEHYSFTVEKIDQIPFDTVTIKDCLPLDKIGTAVGASVNTIRDLNPELTRWCTPPNLKTYTMRVPKGTREKFLVAYDKMDKTQLVRWQQYKVQKGDNLGYISRLFGLKVSDIQAANNLKGSRLSIGQVLIIPMPVGANPPSKQKQIEKTENVAALAKKQILENSLKSQESESNARSYIVRKGDNLGSVSRRFGVSLQSLKTWNNLESNRITAGQKLFLQDPAKKETSNASNASNTSNASVAKKSANAEGGNFYIVKAGDNLWEISKMHDVTVQQILEWNPGLDKNIFPGMKIKIGD